MLIFKDSVRLGNWFSSQICLGLLIADQIYGSAHATECVVTSLDDSQHKPDSLHYKGKAVDLRTRNLTPEQRGVIVTRLKLRLGPLGFDVILEGKDTPNEHIHIEYDPK